MRKLATVLLLLVICFGSSAAQWNLANDPAATLADQKLAEYSVQKSTSGFEVLLKADGNAISDEIFIYRNGSGATDYTIADASVNDETLLSMSYEDALTAQGQATILTGINSGHQVKPESGTANTKVWFSANNSAHSMNFEIRWNLAGEVKITRLPDDVATAEVK